MARQRVVVAVLAISLGSLIACKKKEEAKPTGGSAPTKDSVAPGAKQVDTPAAPAGGDLGLIPVDSEIVLGINWSQLQGSPLWKQFVEPEMKKDSEFISNIENFKTRCGFDPMTAVKTVSIGMKGLGGDMPEGIMVLNGLDKAKSLACVDKWQEEAAKEGTTISKDGDVVLAKDKSGEGGGLTFLSDTRALVVFGKAVDVAAVKKAATGGSTLSTSPAFVEMHGKIAKDQSLWFLANGNSKIFEDAQQLGLRPKAVFGSLNVTDGLSADVRARLDSPDQATQTVANFKGQVDAMKGMVDKLDFTADGADVKLSAAASVQKLQSLMKMFAGGGM
jgi:hypothetical protein